MNNTNDWTKELNESIDGITELLAQMPREKRLQWFRRSMYPKPIDFVKEMDGTRYVVRTFFDERAGESIQEKVKRIASKSSQ